MTLLRRVALPAILAVGLLLAVDFAVWSVVTRRMVAAWGLWQDQAAAVGLHVQTDPPIRVGWPFSADLQLPTFALNTGAGSWQADAVRLRLSALDPGALTISMQGSQTLRIAGLPTITLSAEQLAGRVILSDPGQGTLAGQGLTVKGAGLSLQADDLTAQAGAGLALTVSRAVVIGAGLPFHGVVGPLAVRLHAPTPLVDLAQSPVSWAHDGRQVVVDDASLVWGPLTGRATATGGLDAALQPDIRGEVTVVGYRPAIDALTAAGFLSSSAARVATTMLDLMATGDPPAARLPMTLQHGILAVGAIPLARLPPPAWP